MAQLGGIASALGERRGALLPRLRGAPGQRCAELPHQQLPGEHHNDRRRPPGIVAEEWGVLLRKSKGLSYSLRGPFNGSMFQMRIHLFVLSPDRLSVRGKIYHQKLLRRGEGGTLFSFHS